MGSMGDGDAPSTVVAAAAMPRITKAARIFVDFCAKRERG